jgi:protein TonB
VGGDLRPPKQVRRVDPVYPELARAGRVQGTVVIEAHVGIDGAVKEARVLRGVILLDDAALEAVRQWRYQPLLLNGQQTEFVLTVTVRFNLKGPESR